MQILVDALRHKASIFGRSSLPYKLKMKVQKVGQFPSKELLELQISESLKCSSKYSEKAKISFKLVDVNGDELSIEEVVKRYFSNPGDYFIYI